MPLLHINIPQDVISLPVHDTSAYVIEKADQRIDEYSNSGGPVFHNFVHCDFHLLDQTLSWLLNNHLLTGDRFCEFGSGFGVATLLATTHGMESVGIEIESYLVEQSCQLAEALNLNARFFCGSFVPYDISDIDEFSREVAHVTTEEDDIYQEIGLALDDFDLFFAFPWPGEHQFFEAIFESGAADGACLLTYRGRDGMNLVRKQ